MELKFFKCEKCGKMIAILKGSPCCTMCCGQEMTELVPGTSDGAVEKHLPVCENAGNTVTVKVGEVEHPMMDAHYIEWIGLQTKEGFQMKSLKPGDKPVAVFALADGDMAEAAFAYCNLHGLWKK